MTDGAAGTERSAPEAVPARLELPSGFTLTFRTAVGGWMLDGPAGTTFLTYSDDFAVAFAAAMRDGSVDAARPGGAERYRHRQRGSTYTVVGTATVQAATGPIAEGDSVVVYRADDDGQLWARRQAEFHDGRFERVEDDAGGQ